MTIEELAKEYANRHLDVSEELGCYLVKSVFLDGAEYQREKQDGFAIEFADWFAEHRYEDKVGYYEASELLEIYKKEKGL
jgi:hypothetical protein